MSLTFKPKQITKNLLAVLSDRARDIVERRYGLLKNGEEQMTLEAIGQIYDITRERVRQIENAALELIRKSNAYKNADGAFGELEDVLVEHGGLVREDIFLQKLAKDESTQNHICFLMELGESFVRLGEDEDFHHRWTVDEELAERVHQSLHGLHASVNPMELIREDEIILRFLDQLKNLVAEHATEHKASNWLQLSKRVGMNPMGEWGLSDSPNVKTRGVRDLAYLILRKHGKPLHFSDVAKEISKSFDKKAHIATTHNELIKDDRFVLVGRGLYALSEWGYRSGVVRDVIKSVLKDKGPLSKSDLIAEVLKQRQVKENTIYVNLQNPSHFKKNSQGKYALA